MPTLAAIFPPTQAPERLGAVASAAEAAGLPQLWVWEDCFCQSGIATATAILAATSTVTVGIGLLPVPLRNVALTAMEIATMARLFPGRLTAGVGHGVLDWMSQVGARVESPMTLLREYTAALYALLQGGAVTARGRYVHLDQVALDWPPAVVPPLLVGGIRPRTVALAGELADGLIIPGGVSPDGVRASIAQFQAARTEAARTEAGRTEAARTEAARTEAARTEAGRTEAGRTEAARTEAGRTEAGRTDIVVFVSVPADGTATAAAATISEYARAGATHVAVNAAESDADLARFVGFLAHEVAPLLP